MLQWLIDPCLHNPTYKRMATGLSPEQRWEEQVSDISAVSNEDQNTVRGGFIFVDMISEYNFGQM